MIAIALSLTALAIWDQLVRDPAYRDWHGDVFGVPYDFRWPSANKLVRAHWAPDEDRLLSPHVFGIGWTINAGRIYALLVRPTEIDNG